MVMRRRQKRREKYVKACLHCQRPFDGRANAEYCSNRCRAAAWRERQGRELSAALDEAERALREVRQMLWRDRGG